VPVACRFWRDDFEENTNIGIEELVFGFGAWRSEVLDYFSLVEVNGFQLMFVCFEKLSEEVAGMSC
jgi:hypothetical protein